MGQTTRGELIEFAPFSLVTLPRSGEFSLPSSAAAAPMAHRSAPLQRRLQLRVLIGVDFFGSADYFPDVQAQPFGYASAVRRIGFVEVLNLQLLDAARNGA